MCYSDKLSNSFHAAGTNKRLDPSLPWCASCCPTNCPCSTWSGSWIARFAKESVAPNQPSSAGWIPARTSKSSVGVERKHSMTMRNASLRMLSMRQVCVLDTKLERSTQLWSRPRKKPKCAMSWQLRPIRIPQVASTARLGWRVFLRKASKCDGK